MPAQKKDIFVPNAPAIIFSNPGQRWKIAKDVDVGSGSWMTVWSLFANTRLINKGNVYSHTSDAVAFLEDNGSFINKSTGVVNGGNYGVRFGVGDDAKLVNRGKIIGGDTGVHSQGPGDFELDNSGKIYGYTYGVFVAPITAGSMPGPDLYNEGRIMSDKFAIRSVAGPGLKTRITNDKDGLITGGTFDAPNPGAAIVYSGELKVTNKGTIKGDIVHSDGPALDDTIVNKGKIEGDVSLAAGDDVFKTKNGKLKGSLNGGPGNDTFVLGSMDEKIVFDTALSATTNVDRIKGFKSGADEICLDDDIFASLAPGALPASQFRKGTSAQDGDDYIVYRKGTGAVYYDPDGSGLAQQVQFAQLDAGSKFKASDVDIIA